MLNTGDIVRRNKQDYVLFFIDGDKAIVHPLPLKTCKECRFGNYQIFPVAELEKIGEYEIKLGGTQ